MSEIINEIGFGLLRIFLGGFLFIIVYLFAVKFLRDRI